MLWKPFQHGSNEYSLGHLDSFEWHFEAPASGKRPNRLYKFHVTFSMHCFTRVPLPSETTDNSLWYSGAKERRLFCFDRYELTHQLPEIVRDMGNRPCFVTKHDNFFTIEITLQSGLTVEYEVYFDVTKASRRGWLNLVVQSAYVRTAGYRSQQPRKRKIRLDVIAYKRRLNQDIRPGE